MRRQREVGVSQEDMDMCARGVRVGGSGSGCARAARLCALALGVNEAADRAKREARRVCSARAVSYAVAWAGRGTVVFRAKCEVKSRCLPCEAWLGRVRISGRHPSAIDAP